MVVTRILFCSAVLCLSLACNSATQAQGQPAPPQIWDVFFGRQPLYEMCYVGGPSGRWQPIGKEMREADLVVLGSLSNPRLIPILNLPLTDLDIQVVFKPHPLLQNKKQIVLPRYLEEAKKNPRWLVFFDVSTGHLDAYRGVPIDSTRMLKYVQGIQALQGKGLPQRLQFYLEQVNHKDRFIAQDAFDEICHTEYSALLRDARALPADKIAALLKNDGTSGSWQSLLGFLLGHCQDKQYVPLLRQKIEASKTTRDTGLDGLLIGYTLLEPKEGLKLLRASLREEKSYVHLFASWSALKFFWDRRVHVLSERDIIDMACQTLEGPWPDLAITELRIHKRGEVADRVLALWHTKKKELEPATRMALLRYALVFREKKAAAQMIEHFRRFDPESLTHAEEDLKIRGEIP